MRRFVPIAILLALFVAVAGLSAKDTAPKYKTAEIKHLTKGTDVNLSQDYLNYAYDNVREDLQKSKLFGAVLEDGATVADADAADSVIIECKITDYSRGHFVVSDGHIDITITRRSDHTVVQHINEKFGWPPNANDENKGKYTGNIVTQLIKRALK
jgi:hypothetical protein